MPAGVYKRNDLHRKICSDAGRQSAKSQVNIERYKKAHIKRNCLTCGKEFDILKSREGILSIAVKNAAEKVNQSIGAKSMIGSFALDHGEI